MSREQLHNPGFPLSFSQHGIEGSAFSISGLATFVLVPLFDACFDLGHCSEQASHLRNVFLTHAHQDHSGGVYRHMALRRMQGNRPSRIYLPQESVSAFVEMVHAYNRFEGNDPWDLTQSVHGVSPGDVISLGGRYSVQVFDVKHRIASRGFTVIEHRKKLREAYVGLPGEQIHQARLKGEVVEDILQLQRFTYVGDSTIETLQINPSICKSDVLFFEVTHLPGTPRSRSELYGHTHWEEFVELATQSPELLGHAHFVLKHFSMKYSQEQIESCLETLPEFLRTRVTLLV